MSGYCACRHAWSSHGAASGCVRCGCRNYRPEPDADLGHAIQQMTQQARDTILRRINKPKE